MQPACSTPFAHPAHAGERRSVLLRLASLAGAATVVSGCGWRISGALDFPFQSIMIVAPGQGPQIDRGRNTEAAGAAGAKGASSDDPARQPEIAQATSGGGFTERLRRELGARYRRRLVGRANEAEVVLRIVNLQQQRVVVGFSGTGRPREIEIKSSLEFRVEDALGRPLIPTDVLELRRTISINETDVLSSDDGERFQTTAMEEELIQQILRRLSGLSRRATPVRPPPA